MSISLSMVEFGFKIVEAAAMARIDGLKSELEAKKETIKGLDRATVEYTRIIADKESSLNASAAIIRLQGDRISKQTDIINHLRGKTGVTKC